MSHNIRPGKTLTVYIPYGDIRKYDKNLFNQSGAICILRITPCTLYSSLTWLCTPPPTLLSDPMLRTRIQALYWNPRSVSDPHAQYQTPMLIIRPPCFVFRRHVPYQTPCSISDRMLEACIRPHAQYQTPCLRSPCSVYRPPCSVSDPTHAPYQTIV